MSIPQKDKLVPIEKYGRYKHPWKVESLSLWSFLKWIFSRTKRHKPSASDIEQTHHITPDKLPDLANSLKNSSIEACSVVWLGHSSVLLRLSGKTFLFDPMFSSRAPKPLGPKRYRDSYVTARNTLPPIDYVLISHNHYDHLDSPSLKKLCEWYPGIVWLCGAGVGNTIRSACGNQSVQIRVIELRWFESYLAQDANGQDIQFVFLPAQHNSMRKGWDFNRSLWGGWAVCTPKRRFYFAGDTAYHQDPFTAIGRLVGPFDMAAIPIGAYQPRNVMKMNHINPKEAVQVYKDIGARCAIAIHWGTFPLADEGFNQPAHDLNESLNAAGVESNKFIVSKMYEKIDF